MTTQPPTPPTPQTFADLYGSPFLTAEDLPEGRTFTLTIEKVEVKLLNSKFSKEKVWKTLLHLTGKNGRPRKPILTLNVTQARAVREIANTPEDAPLTAWHGLTINITRTRAHNGKPTILITHPSAE